jgi:hypothetical protein
MRLRAYLKEFISDNPQARPINKDDLTQWLEDSELLKLFTFIEGEF